MPRDSMSAGRTIISPNVAKDRIVTKFPQPYNRDATPYKKIDFQAKVKTACSQNNVSKSSLKISKAVIVGDVAVGKTCLVNRFCHDIFDRDYKATIGVDFEVEKFSILSKPFNLQIWDTAGQERFKSIAASYYRGATVVIVVFDISDIQTLNNAKKWYEDASEAADDPLVFLVGTKKDLVSQHTYRDVEEKAVEVAHDLQAEYWCTSAKSGENVQDFFFRVAGLIFDRAVFKEVDTTETPSKQAIGNIRVDKKDNQDVYERKKSKCC